MGPGNHQSPSLVTLPVQNTVHLLRKLKLVFEESGSAWQLVSFILALQLEQVCLHPEGKEKSEIVRGTDPSGEGPGSKV